MSEWHFIAPVWCQRPGATTDHGGRDWNFCPWHNISAVRTLHFACEGGTLDMWCVIRWQVSVDALLISDDSWENDLNIMGFLFLMLGRWILQLFFWFSTFYFVGRVPQHVCEGQRTVCGSHFFHHKSFGASCCQAWEMLYPLRCLCLSPDGVLAFPSPLGQNVCPCEVWR